MHVDTGKTLNDLFTGIRKILSNKYRTYLLEIKSNQIDFISRGLHQTVIQQIN